VDKVKKKPAARKYKTSPRSQGKRVVPRASERLKFLWHDEGSEGVAFREKMKKRNETRARLVKECPERMFRNGVPNGMRRRDAIPLWERANELADRFIQIMKDVGELPDDEMVLVEQEGKEPELVSVPNTDAGKAEAALREAFVLAVGPSTQQIKIQAINTVLNFTKSKPESKSKLTLNKAEDFLAAVAEDMKSDG